MTTPEIIAVVVVGLFLISCPIAFNLFGKEDRCGNTLWDKLTKKK